MKVNFMKIKNMVKVNMFGKIKVIFQDNFKMIILLKVIYINLMDKF